MIQASFARPVGLFDNWFNKLVARVTGGSFCHSEFIVSWTVDQLLDVVNHTGGHINLRNELSKMDTDQVNICFYVLWGDQCNYRLLKDHGTPFYRMPNQTEYSTLPLDMSLSEEKKIVRFLFDQCNKNYDYLGALAYFLPLRKSQHSYDTYFCSQLMVCSLQHINKIQNVNPSAVTPNKLYNLLLTSY